jgi:hypothetical protein
VELDSTATIFPVGRGIFGEASVTVMGNTFIIPMNTIPNATNPKTTSIIAVQFPVKKTSPAVKAIASHVSQ